MLPSVPSTSFEAPVSNKLATTVNGLKFDNPFIIDPVHLRCGADCSVPLSMSVSTN